MGILKLRDLSLIHDKKIKLQGSAGYTLTTYIKHLPYEIKGLVSKTTYQSYGCCTSFSSQCHTDSTKYENSFIGLEIKHFPSSYRNMELVTKWVNFMNGLFPFFDIKIITDFEQNIVNPEYWTEKELRFTFDNDKIYFVIKKDITVNKYFNLFQLSLLRYFVSNEYYFMIHDCLKLREKKSFSKLSNWQIMNIARFGVQINSEHWNNDIHTEHYSWNYAFLRDYRSPIFNRYYAQTLSTESEVIAKLKKGDTQNIACIQNYLIIDVIYLMKLFQLGHYNKLYKIITNSKHTSSNSDDIIRMSNKLYNGYKNFLQLNNRTKFNYKEYEKTL